MPIQQKEYIRPILLELNKTNNEMQTINLKEKVYAYFTFDAEDLEDMGYGHDRRYKNFHWAKTNLKAKNILSRYDMVIGE